MEFNHPIATNKKPNGNWDTLIFVLVLVVCGLMILSHKIVHTHPVASVVIDFGCFFAFYWVGKTSRK